MAFNNSILWSSKKLEPKKVRMSSGKYNPVMRKLMSNKKIAKALDLPTERNEFYKMVKNVSKGGVNKNEMRELADSLAHGNLARTITHKEGNLIAEGLQKELYPELAKYKKAAPGSKGRPTRIESRPATFGKNNRSEIDTSSVNVIKKVSSQNIESPAIKPALRLKPVKNMEPVGRKKEKFSINSPRKLSPLGEQVVETPSVPTTQENSFHPSLINKKITINADQFHEAKAASMLETSAKLSPQAEALIREKRRKMLDSDEEKSDDEKGDFFHALSATKKNKRN